MSTDTSPRHSMPRRQRTRRMKQMAVLLFVAAAAWAILSAALPTSAMALPVCDAHHTNNCIPKQPTQVKVCPSGYELAYNQCVLKPCQPLFRRVNGVCVLPATLCPLPKVAFDGRCVMPCPAGERRIGTNPLCVRTKPPA